MIENYLTICTYHFICLTTFNKKSSFAIVVTFFNMIYTFRSSEEQGQEYH